MTPSGAIVLEPPVVRAPPAGGAGRLCLGIGGRARTGLAQPVVRELGSVPVGDGGGPGGLGARRRTDGVPARRRRPALAFAGARSRHRRQRVPRLAPRRASHARGSRRRDRTPRGPRPDIDGGHRPALRGDRARARLPSRGRGRRNRGQPRQPGALLVREPDHGRARPRAGATPRDAEAGDRRDDLRLPEVRPRPVPRGRPVERLPGGDERALRRREEDDPRRRTGLSRAVRHERDLPPPRQPVRAGRQLRPRDLARDRRADPQDGRGAGTRRAGDRALGERHANSRVPLRGRLRRGSRAGRRALRRRRPGEHRHRQGDRDRRPGGVGARCDRVRGDDPLGYVEAERAATPQARHDPRRGAVRVHGCRSAGGGPRPDGRLVSGEPPSREHHGDGDPPDQNVCVARPHRRFGRPSRGRRTRGDHRLPDTRHGRALLLGQPQRLAHLSGRRPDLARDIRVAAREGDDRLRPHGTRLADAARTADVDHRLELGAAPPADDRVAGRRAGAGRDARGLRHRRSARGPARRDLVRGGVRGRAVRRNSLLRPALPRLLGGSVPAAGARADPAGRLPLGRRRALVGCLHRPGVSRGRAPRGRACRDVRGPCARAEASKRPFPRGSPRGARARPPVGAPPALRRLARSGAARPHDLEVEGPRRGAALRAGRGRPGSRRGWATR